MSGGHSSRSNVSAAAAAPKIAGASESWQQRNNRAFAVFARFQVDRKANMSKIGATARWDELPESVLRDRRMYEELLDYLLNEYVSPAGSKNAGMPYDVSSVTSTLSCLVNAVKRNYEVSGECETRIFIRCLDPNSTSDAAMWYKRLRLRANRHCFQRDMKAGKDTDQSAKAVYLDVVVDIVRAYMRKGDRESVQRAFAVVTAWQAAGRASEASWISVDSMHWDAHFGQVTACEPQSKSSKWKLVCFAAGMHAYCDWFLVFADYLILHGMGPYIDEEPSFLLPFLRVKSAGQKLTSFMRAVAKRGGNMAYSSVAVEDLDPNITAGGMRAGVVNLSLEQITMLHTVMGTGHDPTPLSALFEYVKKHALVVLHQPVVRVLTDFPPPPFGQCGRGPRPASLAALVGVDLRKLDDMADYLFHINTSTDPRFRQGGQLRPSIRAALATLLKYYQARHLRGESKQVNARVRDSWVKFFRSGGASAFDESQRNAHVVLESWSKLLEARFKTDNAHLLEKKEFPDVERLMELLQAQATQHAALMSQVTSLSGKVEALTVEVSNLRSRSLAAAAVALSPTVATSTPPPSAVSAASAVAAEPAAAEPATDTSSQP